MLVLPEQDAVVAMFSCTADMQALLDLVWEHVVPAMGSERSAPSPDDAALARRLASLSLPTVVERRGGAPPDVPTMTFMPAGPGPTSHRTVSRIETVRGRMIVHEDGHALDVPLTAGWTVADPSLAASAARLAGGRLTVDLVLLATPHRLEIDLDPSTGTFDARWPIVPLFGAGLDRRLATMLGPVG